MFNLLISRLIDDEDNLKNEKKYMKNIKRIIELNNK